MSKIKPVEVDTEVVTCIAYGPEQRPWEETLSQLAKSPGGDLLVSPPTADPLKLHDHPIAEGITSSWYQVPSTGLSEEQQARAQTETADKIHLSAPVLGFQSNDHFQHADCVKRYLSIHVNNGGDPFLPSPATYNTKWMERNVLDYYASLWHAKWPHDSNDPDTYWGYVLTMGSTEGNHNAIWSARDYLSGKYTRPSIEAPTRPRPKHHYVQCKCPLDNLNAFTPVAFYSQETHYSIEKATQALMVSTFYEMGTQKYPGECPLGGEWPQGVPCEGGDAGPGTIDIQALKTLVDFFTRKGHPIIVIFNYGTVFKGAYDDVQAAGEALIPILKKNGMFERLLYPHNLDDQSACFIRKGFWFHVDGALGAAYAPFLRMAYTNGYTNRKPPPAFDFELGFVSSIVTSGHKWIGAPWPCGIFITKTGLQLRPDGEIDIIASPDTTLSGSRNGHSALVLWTYISTHPYEKQMKKALIADETAAYAEKRFRALEVELPQDLWVMRSPASVAICFKLPNKALIRKYSLSSNWLYIKGEWRQYAHIYIMDSVTIARVDEFMEDLKVPGSF